MKRKLLFFIAGMTFSFLQVSAQQADMRVGELLNGSDWFALEEEYPELKDSVQTPLLKLMAEVMIDNNFNRPDEALRKIGQLLYGHQQDMGFGNMCNMIATASVIEGQQGNYAAAADNLKNFTEQLRSQNVNMDLSYYDELANKYDEIRDYPSPAIWRADRDIEIPVSIEPVELLKPIEGKKSRGLKINIPATIHGRPYKFIFDTGAARTYMSEKFAKEDGVKIIKDSVLINEGAMGADYGMKGFLNSMQVGDIVFKNVMITIGVPSAVDSFVQIEEAWTS